MGTAGDHMPPPVFGEVVRYARERMQPDEKALIFCDFIEEGERLARHLRRAGLTAEAVNGESPDRDAVARRFSNEPAPRFLISTKIFSMGVTLVRANHVLLITPWWNEALGEQQPWERVHRPGQTRDVHVNYVILADSFQEVVRERCRSKKADIGGAPKSSELLALLRKQKKNCTL
jgi:SNF2 family DNA or RNA helicase